MPKPIQLLRSYAQSASLFVQTEFIQFHRWQDAPVEVSYLADLHRHVFKVRLEIEVLDQDRELEYHTVLKQLGWMISEDLLRNWQIGWSCEHIADKILTWAIDEWPDRMLYRVTVSEDGENGSTLEARG